MTKSVLLSARIPEKLNADLARLSKSSERTKSRIVVDALRSYVESEAEYLASIEASRKSVRGGKGKSHEAFMAELRKKYVRPK
jgi:predicted transcriptional regulator